MTTHAANDRPGRLAERLLVLLVIAVLAGQAGVCAADPPDSDLDSFERVVITLHPVGRLDSLIIRVADVADIRGGVESLRCRIALLDLDDAPLAGKQPVITPRQVEFRLRVAGIDPQMVMIRSASGRTATGKVINDSESPDASDFMPRNSVLLASYSITKSDMDRDSEAIDVERLVIDAAQRCLTKQLPWPEENVVIQLAQPLSRELRERLLPEETTCSAELRNPGTPLGRVAMRVTINVPGERALDVPVQFDVRHFEEIVVPVRPVARGHVFKASDLELLRQDVTTLTGYCTSADQLAGQKAKRVMPAAQLVRTVDIEPEKSGPQPVLIKNRSRVKVSARSGSLLVVVTGEAQQDGRAGEIIKVKTVDSNATIHGRVLSATEVEVLD